MTIFSHVFITALGVKAMNLTGSDLIYAYAFGVLPDLDHLVRIPSYLKDNGLKIVRKYPWRTFLQEPIMLMPIFVYSVFIKSWTPFIFFGLHVLLDYFADYEKMPLAPLYNFKTTGFIKSVKNIYKEFALMTSVLIGFVII
jgi:hypothetical protein